MYEIDKINNWMRIHNIDRYQSITGVATLNFVEYTIDLYC
ncbi:MPPV-317 putative serine/threonine protein kinase [Magpiepox virus 2]|nr:MPPV-317 putative serine/threonine protein kinase [Magpiepox virus 2]